MLKKIVRFKCSTNIDCAIFVLHPHARKTYFLVRVTEFGRDKFSIKKVVSRMLRKIVRFKCFTKMSRIRPKNSPSR